MDLFSCVILWMKVPNPAGNMEITGYFVVISPRKKSTFAMSNLSQLDLMDLLRSCYGAVTELLRSCRLFHVLGSLDLFFYPDNRVNGISNYMYPQK